MAQNISQSPFAGNGGSTAERTEQTNGDLQYPEPAAHVQSRGDQTLNPPTQPATGYFTTSPSHSQHRPEDPIERENASAASSTSSRGRQANHTGPRQSNHRREATGNHAPDQRRSHVQRHYNRSNYDPEKGTQARYATNNGIHPTHSLPPPYIDDDEEEKKEHTVWIL
ncbi:MAG: hypothetical protein Q9183_008018, partial [Haloplaca sp. 2 TL-2023]